LALLPFVFGQLFTAALIKLKLEPTTALLVVIGIFMGSAINIPVKRLSRTESVPVDQLAVFGLQGWWPMFQRVRRDTIIAVNVGGCLIPLALALYETGHLMAAGWQPVAGLSVAIFINTLVCYWMAQPVEGVGIAMPGLFPAIVASLSTKPLRLPSLPGCLVLSSARICCICATSKRSPPASPASAARGRSTGSCSQESWRRIWHRTVSHENKQSFAARSAGCAHFSPSAQCYSMSTPRTGKTV
jgi:Protein of unknown function (DUF1614)